VGRRGDEGVARDCWFPELGWFRTLGRGMPLINITCCSPRSIIRPDGIRRHTVHSVRTSVASHRYASPVIHSFQDSRLPQGTRVIVNPRRSVSYRTCISLSSLSLGEPACRASPTVPLLTALSLPHNLDSDMATISATPIVIDGKGHLLGRLASIIAKQVLNGQKIVVVRCEEVNISGSFFRNKVYAAWTELRGLDD
jgi:hypothetical protein